MPLFKRAQPKQNGPSVQARQGQITTRAGQTVTTLVGDSGMIGAAYSSAPYGKGAGQQNVLQRIMARFTRASHKPRAFQTTERGASGSASPSNAQSQLYELRYDRRAILTDVNIIAREEPRAVRSTWMFAREACRGGFTIVGSSQAQRGRSRQLARQADEIFRDVRNILLPQIMSLGWSQIVEGDLFIQAVIAGDRLVDLKRMPAIGMERCSDLTDDFPDPAHAFEQVDVATNQTVDIFPQAIMWHGRWKHIKGERYGQSEIASARRLREMLQLQEESQALRRMVRAAMQRVWGIQGKDTFGTEADVNAFRAENGFVEGKQEPFNPYNAVKDYFHNGGLTCETLQGDQKVSDIDDLKYWQNVYASAALPSPPPLYNLDAEAVNRDVLEEVMGQWLNETTTLSDLMEDLVRWAVDLALLLKGILPETVEYAVKFAESSIEKPEVIVKRIIAAYSNTVGLGNNSQWEPLLDKKTAMQKLAPFLGIDDVDAVLAAIQEEKAQSQQQQISKQQQIAALGQSQDEDDDEEEDGDEDGQDDNGGQPNDTANRNAGAGANRNGKRDAGAANSRSNKRNAAGSAVHDRAGRAGQRRA